MTFTFQERRTGCDVVEWVRQVILPRIKRTATNTRYLFPDPLVYLCEFSRAHSWYKHLKDRPEKFYPVLHYGVPPDPTILNYKRKRADDFHSLYWSFVTEESLYEGAWKTGSKEGQWPISIFKKHSFHAGDLLSSFSLASLDPAMKATSAYLAQCVLKECEKLCDIIIRVLLSVDPNPPIDQLLLFQHSIDEYDDEIETRGMCISNRFYKWHYAEDMTWSLDERNTASANSPLYRDDVASDEELSSPLADALHVKKETKM